MYKIKEKQILLKNLINAILQFAELYIVLIYTYKM